MNETKPKILLIDDSRRIIECATEVLSKNYCIESRTSRGEAIDLLSRTTPDKRYACVISDMNLERKDDGMYIVFEATRRRMPCLIVSGDAGGYCDGKQRHGENEVIIQPPRECFWQSRNFKKNKYSGYDRVSEQLHFGEQKGIPCSQIKEHAELWERVKNKLEQIVSGSEPISKTITEHGELIDYRVLIALFATHSCFDSNESIENFRKYIEKTTINT